MRAWYCSVALAASLICLAHASLKAASADEFPYTAEVTAEDVYIRSGPGTNYYPTAKLQKGDMVEVFRQDPGGWCAIRPPRNSFSWVAAQKLTPAEGGLAVAGEDHVVVRVGSTLSDLRDVIQVRLDRRERVEVLQAPDPEDRSGSGWYKIAPPSGEFRWISTKFLQRRRQGLGSHSAAYAGDELAGYDSDSDERTAGGDQRGSRNQVRLTSGDADMDSGPPRRSPTASTTGPKSGALRGAGNRSTAPGPYSTDRELNRLELELSTLVAQDISAWSFDGLKQRTETVLDDAPSNVERGRARLLLNKLARFEDIKIRYDQLHRVQLTTDRSNSLPGGTIERRTIEPRFDGSGRLSPVVSSRAGAPQYALLDGNGAVTHFISPAPGVNLRPFVNKQIGVNGPRSFIPDLQKQVISVQHVAVLEVPRMY